ncbi:MAG: 2-hydroxyacid dehydrogenase [Salinispira sp.]
MNVAVFSTKAWVKEAFDRAHMSKHFNLHYLEAKLDSTTLSLAREHEAVCVFVNDILDTPVINGLAEAGIRTIALRCAGFNNVDLKQAYTRGIHVVRVPAYSPYAVAEHALGLILALNRRYHRAYNRVREGNFSIDGLLGYDIHGKTIGVIGTGKIGQVFCRMMKGFGVRILAYDVFPNEELKTEGVEYVTLKKLYANADIISLHCPFNRETFHMINDHAIQEMKPGMTIINTSRGPLIDSLAVIKGLKSGKIGYLGLDVYEEEADLFFEDLSDRVIQDDTFVRLQTFPNVIITSHQAFFTREAVDNIANTTLKNLQDIAQTGTSENAVLPEGAYAGT